MNLEQIYAEKLASGALQQDTNQCAVVQILAKLDFQLKSYTASLKPSLIRYFTRKPMPPRGIYIHGAVGRGKTMLMDMFFGCVVGISRRRIHFHAFMQEVHALRAMQKTIEQIADKIAAEAKLLCLDEMQIADIADAMIVGRLFEAMHQRGVVLVTTANLPPDELYRDGLNRDLFLPFIAKLNTALDVIGLDGQKDYRLNRMTGRQTYLYPNVEWTQAEFGEMWLELTDRAEDRSMDLNVLGRKLHVDFYAHGCASFDFDDLCRAALGPADFLAIAKNFRTVFVSTIPALKTHERNELKRLILMIDTFYDAGIKLVTLADVPPEGICPKNQHKGEFARTLSRLHEMQSASWWENPNEERNS